MLRMFWRKKMEWTKIPTDLIASGASDLDILAIVKYQLVWALLERKPDDKNLSRYLTPKQIQRATAVITAIERQVNSDIKSVNRKRNRQKIYYEKNQALREKTDGHTDGHTDHHTDVTDKIRLDNTPYNPPRDNNIASPSTVDAKDLNNHPVDVEITPDELAKAEEEVKAFEKMRAERDMFTLGYVRDFSQADEKSNPKKKTKKNKNYGYVGQVIKLTDEDYKKWKEQYPNIDLFKNLNEIDDWLYKNNLEKNWFFRVQKNLQKRNEVANG